jgi:hypothetical protein
MLNGPLADLHDASTGDERADDVRHGPGLNFNHVQNAEVAEADGVLDDLVGVAVLQLDVGREGVAGRFKVRNVMQGLDLRWPPAHASEPDRRVVPPGTAKQFEFFRPGLQAPADVLELVGVDGIGVDGHLGLDCGNERRKQTAEGAAGSGDAGEDCGC